MDASGRGLSKVLTLYKVRADQNMRRQYSIEVGRDLFGSHIVTCRWGRIGRNGQSRQYVCETREDAVALAESLRAKRMGHGYTTDARSQAIGVCEVLDLRVARSAKRHRKRLGSGQLELCFAYPAACGTAAKDVRSGAQSPLLNTGGVFLAGAFPNRTDEGMQRILFDLSEITGRVGGASLSAGGNKKPATTTATVVAVPTVIPVATA